MHVVIILLILFILLYCFAIFPEMSRQKRMKAFHGIMFAHRGLHSKTHGIPENSMSAFRAAIQKNYGIELDLHLTRDGELVVFHDDDLKRVCGRPERPEDLTAAELTKCTLLGTKEHIPLFRDVLALVNDQVPLLVELKIPERNMQICQKAYEMLRSYRPGIPASRLLTLFLRPLQGKLLPTASQPVLVPEKCSGSPKRTIIFQTDKGEIRCILVFTVLCGKSVV